MSLEAARTRMRLHQAYLEKMVANSGEATLLGYSLCPIRSPVFQNVTVCDRGTAAAVVAETEARVAVE